MSEVNAPAPLRRLVEDFEFVDRAERMELLVEYADKFEEVPERIAHRPFPRENHVVRCESDAYVWVEDREDGTQKYYFAVENPQGVSARAWAAVMDETLSGQPLEEVAKTDPEVIFRLFGKELSMGKGQGLMGMLDHVTSAARRKLHAAHEG
ncbi:MAG: SufE family protein [Dehalococcoidia bacterium]|nr:SufE family protein [Dehalococcoidia bacterium]MCA9843282.1 SufE family protein [Dehalococcoidia bacterium]MCA9853786.1 SufE family protein [Dehalococcoidia bacterium]